MNASVNDTQTNIPKIIHWCWFGDKEPSTEVLTTVAHWAELMPSYQILNWNESNFDIMQSAFCKEAYTNKSWAFVSDYARFKLIYEYGGVYMDVGSALVKSIDPLIAKGAFTARERCTRFVSPGLVLAAERHNAIIKEAIDIYEGLDFQSDISFLYSHTVNQVFHKVLEKRGLTNDGDSLWEEDGFTVYPSEYFDPKLSFGGYRITTNTYSTHRSSASWTSKSERFRIDFINKWAPYFGDFAVRKIARLLSMVLYHGE